MKIIEGMKRFREGEFVCNCRDAQCSEDCPHLHLHTELEELTLNAQGQEIVAPCGKVDAPCGYRPADAIVKRCVPPQQIAVARNVAEDEA